MSRKPPRVVHHGTRARGIAAVLALTALAGSGCDLLGSKPEFAVGDCVRIETRVIDSDLEAASCEGAVGTFDPSKRIYRVNTIIENTNGGCPELAGFFPVEFVHEPDGVTYCLVQQS